MNNLGILVLVTVHLGCLSVIRGDDEKRERSLGDVLCETVTGSYSFNAVKGNLNWARFSKTGKPIRETVQRQLEKTLATIRIER